MIVQHVLEDGKERVTSPFGPRILTINGKKVKSDHHGIDLVPLDHIISIERGKVIAIVNNILESETQTIISKAISSKYKGNYVLIQYGNCTCIYQHLKSNSIQVKVGDIVGKGARLAMMGNTGYSLGAHLHFEIQMNNVAVDPLPYLEGKKVITPYVEPSVITKPNELKIGAKVILNNTPLYPTSNGGVSPIKLTGEFTVKSYLKGKKYPILLDRKNGGWVAEKDIKVL